MGLHNPNDWRYHQGRGNLFNTYLGKAPPPEAPGTPRRRADRRSSVAPRTPQPKDAVEALLEFLHYNASIGEANQFIGLVAASKGRAIRPSREPWGSIRDFAREHLTTDEVVRYLAELRRRRAAGEPLIQASSTR
jgi:hypothetical protein